MKNSDGEAKLPVRELLSAFDNLKDIIYQIDTEGNITYVNSAARKVLGYSRKESLETNLRDIIDPDYLEKTLENYKSRLRGEKIPTYETCVISKEGKKHLLEVNASPVYSDGKVVGEIGVAHDITERKISDAALEESKSTLSTILKAAPIGIGVIQNRTIKSVNTRVCEITGYSESELAGMEARRLYDSKEEYDRVARVKFPQIKRKGRGGIETRWKRKDGSLIDVYTSSSAFDIKDLSKGMVFTVMDITEGKEAERSLEESKERYRKMVENSPVAISVHSKGVVRYANKACMRLFGLRRREEFLGKSILDFVHPDYHRHVKDRIRKSQSEGFEMQKGIEERLLRADGSIIDVEVSLTPIKYDGEPAHQAVIRDITEQKRFEEALKESERRYRTTIDSIGDSIHVIDRDMNIVLLNHSFKEWNRRLGLKTDVIGKNVFDVFPFLPPKVEDEYRKVFRRKKPMITHERTKVRGTEFITETRKIPIFKGKDVKMVITIIRDITESMRMQEKLKESEEKFRSLAEQSPNMIFINSGGRIVYANMECQRTMGYTRKEFYSPGFDLMSIIAPESRRLISENLKKHHRGNDLDPYEYLLVTKKGRRIHALITTKLIDYGGRKAIMGIVTDITEWKRMEEVLRESEKRYRGLVESQKDLVVRVDAEGRFTFVNDAYCRKFGKRRNQLLGKTFMPLVHKDDLPATLEEMKKLEFPPHRVYIEQRAKTADGWRWIGWEDYAIKDERGDTVEIQAVGRDITDRKKAEEDILNIKTHLETVLDSISESLVVLDRRYNIVSYNRAFREWVGKPKTDLKGRKCYDIIHKFRRTCKKCVVREVLKSRRPAESVHYHQKKGKRVYHETKAYPIFSDGEIESVIYVFRDVTNRETMKEKLRENYERLLEANLELRQLDRMKTEFLSIASHELRTPLAIIKGYADILRSESLGGLNKNQKNRVYRINENVEHLDKLVNNILDLTKMEAGDVKLTRRKFLLNKLVKEVVEDMEKIASDKGVLLESNVKPGTWLTGDRSRIKQLLVNLMDNALKFTESGGHVKVSAKETQEQVMIAVSDSGIGIRKDEMDKIFKRFYQVDSSIQRRYKGAGLGLAICARIVEMHGGEIEVKSRYRSGTTIHVKLPKKARTKMTSL
ncbi:MAG: PAS domain S-box protein [Candidatus Altiarchaeales archaeon]|nr:PAS domain S-box protein [Candidatus Altiarchaeales archaeon]MBD3415872.1 PAS domain S-box protein [Candidatus Altiarchaeales archaeon]